MTIKIEPAEGYGSHIRSVRRLADEVDNVRTIAETAAGGGIPEAPQDSLAYVRKDGGWEQGVVEAPKNGRPQVRQDGAWVEGVPEAPDDGNEYVRINRSWAEVNPLTVRIAWKAAPLTPLPVFQYCVGNDVANVITFSGVTVPDPRVTVNAGAGIVTFNESFANLDLFVAFQAYRGITGGTVQWGFAIETFVGEQWIPIEDSTRYITFESQQTGIIRPVTYPVSTRNVLAGSQFRFVQSTTDSTKEVGLISDRPLLSLPQSAGAVISLAGR